MSNDLESLQKYAMQEVNKLPVGSRVRWRLLGGKLTGTITDYQLSPFTLISPKFRVKWDNGEFSDWMSKSDLLLIEDQE